MSSRGGIYRGPGGQELYGNGREVHPVSMAPSCKKCNDTGIDQSETDGDGRLTGCACDCPIGEKLMAEYEAEANRPGNVEKE